MDNRLKKIEKMIQDILTQMATKTDLEKLRKDLKKDIDQVFKDVFESADATKADKLTVKVLEKRVDRIEEELSISIS